MVKRNGTIVRQAIINKTQYRVVTTERGKTLSVWDSVDTIRNTLKNKDMTKTRKQWYDIFLKKEWIELPE